MIMEKLFGDIQKGDKLYKIVVMDSRLYEPIAGHIIKETTVKNIINLSNNETIVNLTLSDFCVITAIKKKDSVIVYTTVENGELDKLNVNIYATSKKGCAKALIELIDTNSRIRTLKRDYLTKLIDSNTTMKIQLEKILEEPDEVSMEEFAGMALE